MDLSYKEKQNKLNIRIHAHKEFANIDVGDWIKTFLIKKTRTNILDLGCGNGNHIELYLKNIAETGSVYGIDREISLIQQAKDRYAQANNLFLDLGSMDDPLPFDENSFDLCFSNFAIYNASDPKQTLLELRRVMKDHAELVLIGPTRNNAREMYKYNERLTGQTMDEITLIRTDRLRCEILPIVKNVFGPVKEEVINSYLTFPTKEKFIEYFQATMLYEEGAERLGLSEDKMKAACNCDKDIILSKEMLAIVAVKI